MSLKCYGSYRFFQCVCQFTLILLCSQLLLSHGITALEFTELLSSNETQGRGLQANGHRIKRGHSMSTIPAVDVTVILRDYPVGTKFVSTGGKAPRTNQWNLFELEYDSAHQVFLLKLVDDSVLRTMKKKDERMMDGYWLGTARSEGTDDVLTVTDNEATKFVFTAELQGCSVYAKVRRSSVDFFHYNRPELRSIYVNDYKGSKIVDIRNNFLDLHGDAIIFNRDARLNPEKLYNSESVQIKPISGVIVVSEALFMIDKDTGEKTEIKTIKSQGSKKPDDQVDAIIRLNSYQVREEDRLKEKYDVVIGWEDYLFLPANYPLLMSRGIIKDSFVTGHFYRKNPISPWHFISQRITYTGSKSDGNNWKRMFDIDDSCKLDIEIKKKT